MTNESKTVEEQLLYWKRQLQGAPSLLELPTDQPRTVIPNAPVARRTFHLPARLTASLETLSRDESVTLFVTLVSAFQILMARYSAQDDIVVGSRVAPRKRAATEQIQTLVLRGDLSREPTFRELLTRSEQMVLDAGRHPDVALDMLVQELDPPRSLGHAPLVQVMFSVEHARETPAHGSSVIEPRRDLDVMMTEREGELFGTVEYRSDLFDDSTIARMIGHFAQLLESIVADPAQRISRLPLLTEPERQQLLVEWNATTRDHGPDACIHELFEQQVDRTPDAVAVVAGNVTLTYREVDARANQLAHHLRACGAGPGELVGIFLERSAELVVALLGALKSGAAYVPMDPKYPKDRLAFIHEDARPKVLVTEVSLRGLLPEVVARIVEVDGDAAKIAREPDVRVASATGEDSLSHVIYTSGSSGRPKGVAIEHRVMVNYCRFSRDIHPPAELGAWLFATSICFDMSLFELFVPLSWGGRVYVVENLLSLPHGAADIGFTFVNAVPSVLAAFLSAGALPPSVEIVSCAGEPLPNSLVKKLHTAGIRRVYDFYGPTETFIVTWTVRSGEGAPTIGRPIANTQIYLLDVHGALVPRGVRGELCVGGDGLARGYLHRPELTTERFIQNPFGPGRLYKTGDVARWLPDGTLCYMGRIDNQVKIRGFRVEPGEIEAVLGSHPGVRDAAVIAREDSPGDKRLVAYVVAKAEVPSTSELRAYVKAQLPEYMVPAAFVVLERLPQTPNGKLDRRALPAPPAGRARAEGAYVAPRSPDESCMAEIWSAVLGVEAVGVHDTFFELGGDSLRATQIVSRVRQALQIELPLRSVLEDTTIERLVATIEMARIGKPDPVVAKLERSNRDNEIPLSFAQERLWFLYQLLPDSALYNVSVALRLRGSLDVSALERSLQAAVARHESLRTRFEVRDGRPVQVILPGLEVAVLGIDLRGLPERDRAAEAMRRAVEQARRPFALDRDPLVRASVLTLGSEDHLLVLVMHHLVIDGWSLGILFRELGALYGAFSAGRDSTLPPLEIQYADFAAWQRRWLTGEVLDEQLRYWRRQLQDAPNLHQVPTDRPRPAAISYKGAQRSFQLSASTTASLQALSRAESTTLFVTLLAAFQTLLHRYSGQDDIVVGSPVANRNRQETEGLIGFFVNTLVLRADLSADPSFRELLRRVRETALGGYAHQDVPFEKLVENLNPERSADHAPLFQIMFVFDNNASPSLRMPSIEHAVIDLDSGTSKFDLELSLEERKGELFGLVTYSTDLFDAATIDRMIGHFEQLLHGIVADPGQPISRLPLITAPESVLLAQWNATARDQGPDRCIDQLFEEQVARTPDAIAVVFKNDRVTYHELNRRANQLAHYLRGLGVGADVRVGLCLERSAELIIGMLATFKAHGCYVPLDADYPVERLREMLDDCAPLVVLVDDAGEEVIARAEQGRVERVQRLHVTADAVQWAQEPVGNVGRADGETRDLAYVIYTSGSTGRPKGVMNEHRPVVNLLRWMQETYALTERDVVLQKTQFSFDVSVSELFWPLLVGAQLVMAEAGGHKDPSYLTALIRRAGVTTLSFVPSMLPLFLDHSEAVRCTSVVRVMCAGEALSASVVHSFHARMPWVELHNLYGPTEAAVYVAYWACVAEDPRTSIPIGRPIANTQLIIVDRHMQPVPVGVVGEIYIGGVQVARGYLNRPELTTERFVADPFMAGGRLYKTGDLGRWRVDGTIEYLGRNDFQVKIRGYRIELGEIEMMLASHPAVREAAVVAHESSPGDKRLVAYVVGRGPALDVGELRTYLADRLPEYMVPAAFVTLEVLPQTSSGKLDRKALPAPTWQTRDVFVAPRTATEQVLVGIWSELLGIERVGVDDNFFALGGHSLLLIRLVVSISRRLGVELPPRLVFESPTVAGQAERIDVLARGGREATDVAVERDLVDLVTALTDEQVITRLAEWSQVSLERLPTPSSNKLAGGRRQLLERLMAQHRIDSRPSQPLARGTSLTAPATMNQRMNWDFHQRGNFPTLGIQASAFAIHGHLDLGALQHAIRALLDRHPPLRSTFTLEHEQLRQTVQPRGTDLHVVDLSSCSLDDRQPQARKLFEEISRPHELGREVFRAEVVRQSATEHLLFLVPHHLVVDGFSWGVLEADLGRLYRALAAGHEPAMAPLALQFHDFCFWQTSLEQRPVGRSQLDFWARVVAGYQGLELPGDRLVVARGAIGMAVDTYQAGAVPFAVEGQGWRAVTDLSSRLGCTPYAVIATGFFLLLARWSGRNDVCVTSGNFHRNRPGSEAVVGNFVTPYPLRISFDVDATLETTVTQCHDAVIRHREQQHVAPSSAMATWAEWSRYNLNYLIDVLDTDGLDLGSAKTERLGWSAYPPRTPHDLGLFVRQGVRGIRCNLSYNAERFSRGLAERAAAMLGDLITAIAAEPSARVATLPVAP